MERLQVHVVLDEEELTARVLDTPPVEELLQRRPEHVAIRARPPCRHRHQALEPLLETRYRLNRERFPLGQALHFDLLHPARRLWKARLESCRLQSLERALLGVTRRGDVPGEEIPRIYFDFVRRRDGRAMARVLEHNRLDVLSLAALAALACQWVEGGHAEDPRDVYCLGRVLERAALYERSEEQYRRLLTQAPGPVRTASLLRLAARAKKAGQMETAVAYWEEAAQSGDWLA
ncbi:MAG TPA: ribonuclease H-like domain-containing protein, partial [Planctomycetota bacterium]|nr:ribonuclease H-like domain-containing protein [Planctomycetota bacterium]